MSDNIEMFKKAKVESEILFKNALSSTYSGIIVHRYGYVRFESIFHVDESMKILDCDHHADVVARAVYENKKHQMWLFDVKDVEDKWIHTKNYSIPKDQVDFYMSSLDEHWIAFRLNDGISKKFDKFYVVNSYDICKRCAMNNLHNEYCLVSLDDVKSCERHFEVEVDF